MDSQGKFCFKVFSTKFVIRFFQCCKNGLESALKLVSRCTNFTESSLENLYRSSCSDGSFAGEEYEGPTEEDLLEDGNADNLEKETSCIDVLQTIKDESDMLQDGAKTVEDPAPFAGVPDEPELQKTVAVPASEGDRDDGSLPATLQEALMIGGGDLFNALWRLCVRLRSDKGGSDCRFLPNARGARRTSKRLNWHQWNEHQLAVAEAQLECQQHRVRSGRLEAWRSLSQQAREQLKLPPEGPERLRCLGLFWIVWVLRGSGSERFV